MNKKLLETKIILLNFLPKKKVYLHKIKRLNKFYRLSILTSVTWEFSSLIWKNFFKEEIIPGEEIEILLKMLKNEKLNFDQPYFTCLRFHLWS